MFIERKTSHDAGSLADFFVSAIDTTFSEKLSILEAIDVKLRLERTVDIVQMKVSTLREAIKGIPGQGKLEEEKDRRLRQMVLRKRRPSGGFFSPPADSEDANEQSDEENDLQEIEKAIKNTQLSTEGKSIYREDCSHC